MIVGFYLFISFLRLVWAGVCLFCWFDLFIIVCYLVWLCIVLWWFCCFDVAEFNVLVNLLLLLALLFVCVLGLLTLVVLVLRVNCCVLLCKYVGFGCCILTFLIVCWLLFYELILFVASWWFDSRRFEQLELWACYLLVWFEFWMRCLMACVFRLCLLCLSFWSCFGVC